MKGSRRGRNPAPASPTAVEPGLPSGILYVVATPIGNLEDITLRALRILREVALVAAEDTRRTANLLRHYQIGTPLLSLHQHNEHGRVDRLLADLLVGKSIALVSDAGTPGISDPGALIVRQVRAAGFRVEPIPGPSAVTAAISAAGIEADGFAFYGFPPPTGRARLEWLKKLAAPAQTTAILFEAPHRIQRLLKELEVILGDRPILVARELTKRFEEWISGPPAYIEAAISDARGEFVVMVPPQSRGDKRAQTASDDMIVDVFGQLTDSYVASRRDAIRQTADKLGLSPKAVFEAIERAKQR
jgi:16S rRNA (cytidine1402-2'-O)-methyltransferase